MIFLRFTLIAMLLTTGLTRAQSAEEEVFRSATPDWVKLPQWDNRRDYRERESDHGDTHYLLFNQQHNATLEEEASYRHIAYQFLTSNGVQNESQLEITFDPEYQTLTLHSLRIHRDGTIIDRLSSQNIEIIQREEDINRHLFDGRLSAVLLLEDIRIGDILEYSYTRSGTNPIFDGYFGKTFSTEWSIEIDSASCRLLWNPERSLRIKSHKRETKPIITKQETLTEYYWDFSAFEPVISDGELPSWFDGWGWVQLSDFSSWQEVAQWAVKTYDMDMTLPDELEAVSRNIKKRRGAKERALDAIRYVQDEIRYFGVESGVNSHKPHPLPSITARRFGDCKDKSVLLTALLRDLGFEAYPALVNTIEEGTIADWLPSISAFNHVIVQLHAGDEIIWIDPTIRLQGGTLENLYFPDYGKALVISPKTTNLDTIHRETQDSGALKIVELFDFQDYDGDGILRVESRYTGHEADHMRRTLSRSSIDDLGKNYLNFYADIYKEVTQIDPPKFYDDRETNSIISFESYKLSDFWKLEEAEQDDGEDRLSAALKAWNFTSYLRTPDTRKRKMPFELASSLRVTQETIAEFPWPLDFDSDSFQFDLESSSGSFERSSLDGSLHLKYSHETKKNFVSAENTAEYIKAVEALDDKGYYSFTIPKFWADGNGGEETETDHESQSEQTEQPDELNKTESTSPQSNRPLIIGLVVISIAFIILLVFVIFLIRLIKKQNARHQRRTPPPLPSKRNS